MIRSIRFPLLGLALAATAGALWHHATTPAYSPRPDRLARDARGAAEWLRSVQADPITGEYDLAEIQKVRKAVRRATSAQRKSVGLNWIEMGPDNVGGRTRSIVIDPSDPSYQTLWAGGVSGGLWRTFNGGNTWQNMPALDQNLIVTSIAILGNGHIYVGTGNSFEYYNGAGSSGIMGAGLFKSTDNGSSFSQVIGPSSAFGGGAWAEVNKVVADPQNSDGLYVGSNAGFKYYDESDDLFTSPTGPPASAPCRAIEVSADGSLMVVGINSNQCWVSTDGGDTFSNMSGNGLPTNASRMEFAVSPDPGVNNYIYALQSAGTSGGQMLGVFSSTDQGQNWTRIWPQGYGTNAVPELDIFGDNAQGWYDNVCAVRPNHPDEVWVGGVELWKTTLSGQPVRLAIPDSQLECFVCVHADVHEITFVNENTCYIGTDGGVYKTTAAGGFFYGHNRDYITTQYYGIAFSPKGKVIGGLQDNGTLYLNFEGNTPKEAIEIGGGDGFDCDISQMDPRVMFSTVYYGAVGRSNDEGVNFGGFYSTRLANLLELTPNTDFFTNIRLYEDFDDELSTDSVDVVYELDEDEFLAPGATETFPYYGPITGVPQYASYTNTTADTLFGPFASDTMIYQDRVTSLFALGLGGTQGIWVTRDAMDFSGPSEWWRVTNQTGEVQALEWAADGNDLFIGTSNGRVWRVHGFRTHRDSLHCDISSDQYALATTQIFSAGNAVTGLAPDPNNTDHLVITLGNYGGSQKVRESFNAVSSATPTWSNIWNPGDPDLNGMPVYDAIIHKGDPETIVVGTEYGIMATNDGGTTWSFENSGIPRVPTFALRQQSWDWNHAPFGGGYIENPWVIYAGTHGRGIWRTETLMGIGGDGGEALVAGDLTIFPNPASTDATIGFALHARSQVTINVYDMNGRLVKQQKAGPTPAGLHQVTVDVSSLRDGAYIAELNTGAARKTARFVVSR